MKIYKITNDDSNNIYIGKTKQTLEERFKGHIYDGNQCTSKIVCNGLNPKIDLLYDGDLFTKMGYNQERNYIDRFKIDRAYNVVNKNKPKHKIIVENYTLDDIISSDSDDDDDIICSDSDDNDDNDIDIKKDDDIDIKKDDNNLIININIKNKNKYNTITINI